jgi:hypothetical protein
MDDRYIDSISKFCDKNKTIIPINQAWLFNNSNSWKKLDLVKEIMNSFNFKYMLKDRINNGNPEALYPEYNIINHSKIDFIKFAIDNGYIKNTTLICWSDFGYYNSILHNNPEEFPQAHLDITRLNLDKINFFLRHRVDTRDYDMFYTLTQAPEVFTGSFFAGSTKNMLILHELYHDSLNELYKNNISDDDQHVYLRCFFKKPDIFELFLSEDKWPQALLCFQKKL